MVMQPPPTRGEGAATGSAGSRAAARARERRRSIAAASAPHTALSIPWSTLLRRPLFTGSPRLRVGRGRPAPAVRGVASIQPRLIV